MNIKLSILITIITITSINNAQAKWKKRTTTISDQERAYYKRKAYNTQEKIKKEAEEQRKRDMALKKKNQNYKGYLSPTQTSSENFTIINGCIKTLTIDNKQYKNIKFRQIIEKPDGYYFVFNHSAGSVSLNINEEIIPNEIRKMLTDDIRNRYNLKPDEEIEIQKNKEIQRNNQFKAEAKAKMEEKKRLEEKFKIEATKQAKIKEAKRIKREKLWLEIQKKEQILEKARLKKEKEEAVIWAQKEEELRKQQNIIAKQEAAIAKTEAKKQHIKEICKMILYIILYIVIIIITVIIYLLPSIIVIKRNHPTKGSIIIFNIFLGWTFIVWVVLLAWSLNSKSIHITIDKKEPKEDESK